MPGVEDESYLDKLLGSIENAEENGYGKLDDMPEISGLAELLEEQEVLDDTSADIESMDDISSLLSDIRQDVQVDEPQVVAEELQPDFMEPELTESDKERLANIELDTIIEDVTAESFSVEELFGDGVFTDFKLDANEEASEPSDTEEVASVNELAALYSAVSAENEDSTVATVVESPVNDMVQDTVSNLTDNQVEVSESEAVMAAVAMTAVADSVKEEEQMAQDNNATEEVMNDDNNGKKSKKAKKEKKDKSQKKGLGAAIKNIFFESEDSTKETEDAKKKGKKAAQEAKDTAAKDNEPVLKETVLNADGEEVLDENQRLLKEMYGGEEQGDEVAPKKGFFAKLKYRLSQFMKKSAEEDKAEQEAEEKDYEERQKVKAEKKEADRIKKEEAKAQRSEEAKKKKEAKPKKEKPPKPQPKPGDILKIKPTSMLLFIMFVAGTIVLICMLNSALGYNGAVSTAKASMQNGDYAKAYEALAGLELKGNDQTLYDQVSVIMYVERHYESYQNYTELGMHTEALDALVTGLKRYNTYYSKAVDLGVDKQLIASREIILAELTGTFKISEAEASNLMLLSETNYTEYFKKIEAYGKAR